MSATDNEPDITSERKAVMVSKTTETDKEYPHRIWVERDEETNEKRWFSCKGMGVEYVRADRDTAVLIERERIKTILLKRGPFPRPYVQELIEAIDEGNK